MVFDCQKNKNHRYTKSSNTTVYTIIYLPNYSIFWVEQIAQSGGGPNSMTQRPAGPSNMEIGLPMESCFFLHWLFHLLEYA
jgi:hypothetical protein